MNGLNQHPQATLLLPEVDRNVETYDHEIEKELLSPTPRHTYYSRSMRTARLWWLIILAGALAFWLFGARQSLVGKEDINDYLLVFSAIFLAMLAPVAQYAFIECECAKQLRLLREGVAVVARVRSGYVDESDGTGPVAKYIIKYHVSIWEHGALRLQADTMYIPYDLYLSLTTQNPLFTLLYNPQKPEQRMIYRLITAGSLVERE